MKKTFVFVALLVVIFLIIIAGVLIINNTERPVVGAIRTDPEKSIYLDIAAGDCSNLDFSGVLPVQVKGPRYNLEGTPSIEEYQLFSGSLANYRCVRGVSEGENIRNIYCEVDPGQQVVLRRNEALANGLLIKKEARLGDFILRQQGDKYYLFKVNCSAYESNKIVEGIDISAVLAKSTGSLYLDMAQGDCSNLDFANVQPRSIGGSSYELDGTPGLGDYSVVGGSIYDYSCRRGQYEGENVRNLFCTPGKKGSLVMEENKVLANGLMTKKSVTLNEFILRQQGNDWFLFKVNCQAYETNKAPMG